MKVENKLANCSNPESEGRYPTIFFYTIKMNNIFIIEQNNNTVGV